MRAHMGSGIYGLVPAHFLPIFCLAISFLLYGKNAINIDLV